MIPKSTIEELLEKDKDHQCPPDKFGGVCVKIAAVANLPSRFGHFQIAAFYNDKDKKEHTAVIKGDVFGKENVPTRVHSECLTGDVLGSLRCDCRDQLLTALKRLGELPEGVLLYLRQEGRGIGLTNKIKAYALQDLGYDTIEADHLLGFSGDEREYNIAAHMLFSLNVKSIQLMTNNPRKMNDLTKHGVKVTNRIPLVITPNEYNKFYLETKQRKAGHLLDRQESEQKLEQWEEIIVE